jgi:hypothetical protein
MSSRQAVSPDAQHIGIAPQQPIGLKTQLRVFIRIRWRCILRFAGAVRCCYSRRAGIDAALSMHQPSRRGPSWRSGVNECEIDISVGETLCLGDINVTILDIENGEIHFRIESAIEDSECDVEFDEQTFP